MVFKPDQSFLKALYVSGSFVAFLPLIIFGGSRFMHRNGDEEEDNYGQNQYDNNQQQNCRWWQWGCSNYDENQQDENGDEDDNALPWWWLWSEDERRRDPEDMVNPTLVVIYLWTLVMMGGILFYAYKTVKDLRDMVGLAVSLLMLANFSFISMMYLGSLEGAVDDDGKAIEEQGFYGQFGVMLYLTNLLACIFAVGWFFMVRRMINDQHTTKVDFAQSDYMKYDEPTVQVIDSQPV
jgi:hypothetical protein